MASPRISVVVPVFNGGALISETIDRVLAQTFADWELLIIDDGSTDDTRAIVGQFVAGSEGRIQLLTHDRNGNRGTCMSRIVGAENARGDVVALLDHDDIWDDCYLERHLAFWDSVVPLNVAMTYGPVRVWHPGIPEKDTISKVPAVGVYAPGALLEDWHDSGFETGPGCGSVVFLRPEIYPQIRRFANLARGSHAEDQYLFWHVGARFPIAVHDGAWARYRKHASATTELMTSRSEQRDLLVLYEAIAADLAEALPAHPLIEARIPKRIAELRRDLSFRMTACRALSHPIHTTKRASQWAAGRRPIAGVRMRLMASGASVRAWCRRAMRRLGHRIHRFVRSHRALKALLGWFSMRVGLAPADSPLRRLLGSSRAFIRGEMDAGEVHRVLNALDAAGLHYWLAGGWGVDALIGVQSRSHDDLDIVLESFEQTEPVAREVMASLGYRFVDSQRDDAFPLPCASTFDDGEGHKVQLVSLAWRWLARELGLPATAETGGPNPGALVEAVSAEGMVDGRRVPCVSIKTQHFLHADHPSAHAPSGKKHRSDIEALQRADPQPPSRRSP